MNPLSPLACGHRNRQGIALLITLCSVVLLTGLILAFFSNSLLNRQISYSNTNVVKADQLARSALEIIIGEIREEIADPSYSLSLNGGSSTYPTYYYPKTSANAIPVKVSVAGTASTNLYKVSANNSSIDPGQNGRSMGSPVLISTASRNGRFLSTSRWFGTGGPGLGSNTTLPTWVYVTRSGVQTPVLADVADPKKTGYVIGRFAYTVYDVGGLLDANVAGYPTIGAAMAPFKPSLAFADIGGVLGISGLASWRNPSTGIDANTFAQWAAGLPPTTGATNAAALAGAASGHLSVVAGDNAFFSRHDLLRAAQNSVAGLTTAQAGLLTHFTRSLNAPSCSPVTPTTANPRLTDVRFSGAGTIHHYDDAGVDNPYPVLAGDSLIQHRFSLAKVGWISASGAKAGISPAAIQASFGLVWNTAQSRWDYVGATGSTLQTSIKTLDQVAQDNREPNFFELLKAGILAGSLGKASANVTFAQSDQRTLEGNKDFQTFQIGVNIIDCAGADNYPTRIGYGTVTAPYIVYGVKDLPYLYGVLMTYLSKRFSVSTTQEQMHYCHMILVPELFNPHASVSMTTPGPSKIQIRIVSGTVTNVTGSAYGMTGPLYQTPASSLAAINSAIVVPSTSFENYRSAMKPVRNGEATSDTTLNTLVGTPIVVASDSDINAFKYYFYPYTAASPSAAYNSANFDMRTVVSNLFIVLEYQDAAGAWHIYDTWAGNEAFSALGTGMGIGGNGVDFGPPAGSTVSTTIVRDTMVTSACAWKIDPRTTRFTGSRPNTGPGPLSTPVGPVPPPFTIGFWGGLNIAAPFSPAPGSNTFYPGNWLTWKTGGASKTGWSTTYADNVADADGILRPPDGWLGSGANFMTTLSTTTAATGRPVILHRLYRSVAELGYVFRATPWKTLSFFDDTSADGALLDLFSVSDEPRIVAGRLALSSPQVAMQQALLSGVGQSYDGTNSLSSALGSSIATAYQTYAYTSGVPTATMPVNSAQLPSFMTSTALTGAYATSTNPIKYYREGVVRALTAGTQTRTWNLLIDTVAQVGRFQPGTTPASLADFIVEGEKRYWLFVAIDRYTGKVIEEQFEPANE